MNTYIEGETTLYGTIQEVVGEEPHVLLHLIDGQRLTCAVSETIAQALAARLYSKVGLTGIAKWDMTDYSINAFQILEITEYQETPITEAFALLSEQCGRYFEGVNAIDYVSKLRSEW